MREWMIKNWGITLFIILAITWILVCTVIGVANAAEIVTLEPGQADTTVTCETELRTITSVDADCGHLEFAIYEDTTICDTVIVKAVEADTNRTVWSKCPRCDWPQAIEAPRYECKRKPLHPLNGLGPGWRIDGIYTCTHPECAPKPDTCGPQTWSEYDIDKIVSVLLDKFWNDTVPWLKGVEPFEATGESGIPLLPLYECKKPCEAIGGGVLFRSGHCTHPECAPEPASITMTFLHIDTALYIRGQSGNWYKATEELDRLVWLKTDEIKGDRSDACIEINRHEGTTGIYVYSPVQGLKVRGYDMPLIENNSIHRGADR